MQTHIRGQLDHVVKKVVVPNEHLKALVDIYRLLYAKGLSTASRASAMKVCLEAWRCHTWLLVISDSTKLQWYQSDKHDCKASDSK